MPRIEETYTIHEVQFVLKNYLHILSYLDGSLSSAGAPTVYIDTSDTERNPLGYTKTGQAWPFMSPKHAKVPMDGKKRARAIQELHVSVLDVEEAIKHLSKDDRELVFYYYVLGYTMEDCAKMFGIDSRRSMPRKLNAVVKRLVTDLNKDKRCNL